MLIRIFLMITGAVLLAGCAATVPGSSAGAGSERGFGDTIPTETARLFLGGTAGVEVDIYRDLPDDFPSFEQPEGFAVLGAMERLNSRQVFLGTRIGEQAAEEAIMAAFTQSGWTRLPNPAAAAFRQQGFVAAGGMPEVPERLCHDEFGVLNVRTSSGGSQTVVALSQNNAALARMSAQSCEQLAEQGGLGPRRQFILGRSLRQYLPRMELPEEAEPVRGFGGGSTSGDSVSTSSGMSADWPLDEVYTHFAEQIEQQGWTPDTDWRGTFSAGGTWFRSPGEDLSLVGTLIILEREEDTFQLDFYMVRRGSRESAGSINSINSINVLRAGFRTGPPLIAP